MICPESTTASLPGAGTAGVSKLNFPAPADPSCSLRVNGPRRQCRGPVPRASPRLQGDEVGIFLGIYPVRETPESGNGILTSPFELSSQLVQ